MIRVCNGCGQNCDKNLKCPTCLREKNQKFYFCSQECFGINWDEHKKLHEEFNRCYGVDSLKFYSPDDSSTWKNDSRCFKFVGYKFTGPLRPWPMSVQRKIPNSILLPDYAITGRSKLEEADRDKPIRICGDEEIQKIKECCLIARKALDLAHSLIKVGIKAEDIDANVHDFIISQNAYPSPLNYYKFPKSCCISVNEVICHGIPDYRPLEDGDIVNVDITVYYKGVHGDLSETYAVGNISEEKKNLIQCTYDSLMKAISICKPGVYYKEIGNIIEEHVNKHSYNVVRTYTGHGINVAFHTNPYIYHFKNNLSNFKMKQGHVFTIEPMINLKSAQNEIWPDNWTVVTSDGQVSAQFEHQILITKKGYEILTARLPQSLPLDINTKNAIYT